MAKKQTDETTKGKPYGIYLNKEISADVERLAAELTDGNYHKLLQFAIKYFIHEYDAGRVKLKKKTVTNLELD